MYRVRWLMSVAVFGWLVTLSSFVPEVQGDLVQYWPFDDGATNAASDTAQNAIAGGNVGDLYPMVSRTFGGPNSGPRIGPVIFSEIHYNPVDPDYIDPNNPGPIDPNDLEFVEIYNPTGAPVDLSDVYFTDATYQEVLGFPALGRAVRGGLRLALGGGR